MLGMTVEMIYGVPEMLVVMPGSGEVMLNPSKRYSKDLGLSLFINLYNLDRPSELRLLALVVQVNATRCDT